MLAKQLPSILAQLNLHKAPETTKIHFLACKMPKDHSLISIRPFPAEDGVSGQIYAGGLI